MRIAFGGCAVLGVLFAWAAGCGQPPTLQHAPPLVGSAAGTGGAEASTSTTHASAGSGGTTTGTGGGSTTSSTGSGILFGSDVLSPDQVYLAGTLAEGSCGRDAIVHWSSPNVGATGFDCYFDERTAKIRPTDGRLLYVNTFEDELREFSCDDCPFTAQSAMYPPKVLDNDTVLSTLPCDPATNPMSAFLISPDDGSVLHTCQADAFTWYDATGAIAYASVMKDDQLLHLGHGGKALTESRVIDLLTQAAVSITGLPANQNVDFVRALAPDKFLVVLEPPTGAPDHDAQELWSIDATGVATMLGVYPPLPAGTTASSFSISLDSSGALFEFGEGAMVFEDIILRRIVGGASEVVYDEANKPLVKIHISALVTGP
jgi:hypothetical protein